MVTELPTPLTGFWNTDTREGILRRPGGAISERRAFIESTHMGVAEPGSLGQQQLTFCIGRLIATNAPHPDLTALSK